VIPFLDVAGDYRELQIEIDEALSRVVTDSQFVLGPEVEAFESEFAAYVGARHCVGVGSGLDALLLSLVAHDIGPGDEVIVPSNTFIATWLAVSRAGATIVPVEPDIETRNVTLAGIEPFVTAKTKALLPVHLYGYPVDVAPMIEFGVGHGIVTIEDAAQAHGAEARGRRVGSLPDTAAWSFYPGKNLGAFGDGGAITTSDPDLARALRLLRNYGSPSKGEHVMLGFNSRLDEIHAAVLRVKLRHLDEWNARRRAQANRYREELHDVDVVLPVADTSVTPSWHLFVIRHPHRDDLRARLALAGVSAQVHYPAPPHLQPAYRALGFGPGSFPTSELLHQTVLSLPIGPHLTSTDQEQVIDAVKRVIPELSEASGHR
jgi:dTDP-4-amino-4,6-dideoxygalactose transaminase